MKRLLSIALAAMMTMALCTGCGGSQEEASSAASEPASSGSSTAAPTGSSEWPAIGSADAPVTVSLLIKDVLPTEEDVIEMEKVVEEKMASHGQYIDLVIVEPPAGSYGTAVPLGLRTGEIDADIIYFQGGDLAIAQEGLLEDLTPYVEGSTFVKEIMLPVNEAQITNYPYLLWLEPARIPVPVMRKDWAESLDSYAKLVEDPTVDNYYALFKEMKDKGLVEYALTTDNANNNGDGNLARINSIFNQAFGVTATLVKQDGKWVFSKATEAEKNKLEFYAKLYAEGLLDPEYLTNTWDVMEQKFYDGKAGMIAGNAGDTIKIYNDKMVSVQGTELVALPPAKGVAEGYSAVDTTKASRGFAINAYSENKDAAWAFLEFMASPEGRILDKCGIEGKHYNIENNQIVFTDRFPEWWSRIHPTTNNFNPEPPLAEPIYSQAAQDSLTLSDQYYVEDVNVLVPEELTAQWDAMKLLYDEYSADFVRGVKPLSEFDDFVAEWNAAGGDAFSEYLAGVLG